MIQLCFMLTLIFAVLCPHLCMASKTTSSLNIAFKEEIFSFDCYDTTDRRSVIVGRHIYDSLLYRDPQTGDYLPLLAESYRFIDNTSIELTLRQNIRFHNNQPFSADDVVFTLSYAINPENKIKGRQIVEWISQVKKLGPFKVLIVMKNPFPAALEYLSGITPIYPHRYYREVGPDGMGKKPIGTGPYIFKTAIPGQRYEFYKNTNYFSQSPKGQPKIDKLTIHIEPDLEYQISGLKSGRFDWIWKVPSDKLSALSMSPDIKIVNEETMRIGYLQFDCANRTQKNSPVLNLKVRQAIAHAIDRESIIEKFIKGNSKVIHGACFPSQFGCSDPEVTYHYDPNKSKRLLADAGFRKGFQIDLYAYRDRPLAMEIMKYLKAINVSPNLYFKKYNECRDAVRLNQVEFCFMTWGSYSVNDVSAITSHFFKGSKDDLAQDPELIALLTKADNTVLQDKRKMYYKKALNRIATNLYWLPLWSYNYNYAFNKNLVFKPQTDEIPRFFNSYWQKMK